MPYTLERYGRRLDTELMQRLDEQAQMVSELRTVQRESITRITSSLITPEFATNPVPRKMTRNPELPHFSGEKPTPRGEVEFDNWISRLRIYEKPTQMTQFGTESSQVSEE